MARDYSVCPENSDGHHGPLRAGMDQEIEATHVTVECVSCGISTGYPISAIIDDLEWN